MSHTWHGPCEALKAASADPLWRDIHGRGRRFAVACLVDDNGLSAMFYRVEKRGDHWYQFDLGRVAGSDPYSTALVGYRQFTPFDADLLRQNHAYVERLANDVVLDGHSIVSKLGQAADEFLPS